MKAKKVLKLLQITRPTLSKYINNGKLKGKRLPNGYYDYDPESVYHLMGKSYKSKRYGVIYCRVSTPKQKQDLENQKETIRSFCNKNGIKISKIYQDIGSGINFDRKGFSELLNDVIDHKVSKVYITYKDRLSRISFDLFKNLFAQFDCEIVVLNEINDSKLLEKEIFKEIVDLIHCFAMKLYSKRRKEKLQLIEKDLKLEDENK